jgi:hypothetical protein
LKKRLGSESENFEIENCAMTFTFQPLSLSSDLLVSSLCFQTQLVPLRGGVKVSELTGADKGKLEDLAKSADDL